MKKNNTEDIEKKLLNADSYDEFLKETTEALINVHPGEYLLEQLRLKNMKKKDIVKAVDLNTGYVYEIFRMEKRPERDKMLRFAFPLGLDLSETQAMLRQCGYALLYAKKPRDSVVMFCISRRKSLIETNMMLQKYEFDLL